MSDVIQEDTDQSRGGHARASKLSRSRRSEIARNAALQRWKNEPEELRGLPKASHSGELPIGSVVLQCYVLENGTRLFSQRGLIQGLAMKQGGHPSIAGDRLTRFLAGNGIKDHVSSELAAMIREPVRFKTSRGAEAYGYPATVLPEICSAVLDARAAGKIQKQQQHIVARCEILLRALSKVGVIALVDEATGYQAERKRNELHQLLEAFIAKELLPWSKMFPDEFYQQMFRLNGWAYEPGSVKRPACVGKYTHDTVYARLPPGVIEELKRLNPTDGKGRRKHKHHQFLTTEIGHPTLKNHLVAVTALMRASKTWSNFNRLLERAYPKAAQQELPLEEADD